MKRTDLILVCPAKFGGWMMKNPLVAELGFKQYGITKMLVTNAAGEMQRFYTKDPDAALTCFAELIATENGYISLDASSMRDLIVPENEYSGDEEDEDDET